jgi:hypothetical protein
MQAKKNLPGFGESWIEMPDRNANRFHGGAASPSLRNG